MRPARALTLERVVLATLALIGASAVWGARHYADGTAHGGALMPMLAGGSMALLAGVALVRAGPAPARDGSARRPWAALIGTAAFLAAMPVAGFPVVAPAWVAGTMILLGARAPLPICGAAILLPLAAYLLLARLAFAPPPMGPFGG